MTLQPSGPFSTDVVTQMESADPATAFTALQVLLPPPARPPRSDRTHFFFCSLQQAFEFAQCQLNTRMPLLTAGVVDVMLQKVHAAPRPFRRVQFRKQNFFDSPSPDTRLLALSLLFNLCNVGGACYCRHV